ncbi:MAG: hypothetical protein HQL98_04650 [Magnetococcales bacterium]|nr:hypothetical protein [Magnetococcales bacterium]
MPRILFSRKPGVCRPSILLSLVLALCVPVSAEAFSLGDMRISSSLGEPFRAEIPVLLAPGEEHADLSMILAGSEEYRLMELVRSPAIAGLTATLSPGQDRQRRVTIRGKSPITDPFFHLLLKGSVGRGSQIRAYRVMLDPAPRERGAPVTPMAAPNLTVRQTAATGTSVAKSTTSSQNKNREKPKTAPAKSMTPGPDHGVAAPTAPVTPAATPPVAPAVTVPVTPAAPPPVVVTAPVPPAAPPSVVPAPPSPVSASAPPPVVVPDPGSAAALAAVARKPDTSSSGGAGNAAAEPSRPAVDSDAAVATRLADTLQQLKSQTERYEELNQKFVKSEAERERLRSRLSAMTKRVETLETEKLVAMQEAIDWTLVGGAGATGVAVLVGGLVWWRRRERPEGDVGEPSMDKTAESASVPDGTDPVSTESKSAEGFTSEPKWGTTAVGSSVVPVVATGVVVPLLAMAAGLTRKNDGENDSEEDDLEPVGLMPMETGQTQDSRGVLFLPDLDDDGETSVELISSGADDPQVADVPSLHLPEIIPFSMDQALTGGMGGMVSSVGGEGGFEEDPLDVIEFERERIVADVAAEQSSGDEKADKREWPTLAQEDDDAMVLEISEEFSGHDDARS